MNPQEIATAVRLGENVPYDDLVEALLFFAEPPESAPSMEIEDRYGIKFTRREAQILDTLLLRQNFVSREKMFAALYATDFDPPASRTIDVLICRLRKKLEKTPIEIVGVWGRGWTLKVDAKAA